MDHTASDLTWQSALTSFLHKRGIPGQVRRTRMIKDGEHYYYLTDPNGVPMRFLGQSYKEARKSITAYA